MYVCMFNYTVLYATVLAEEIYLYLVWLPGRPDSMKMKCPQQLRRDSWDKEKIGSVLEHSHEAGRRPLRGGQRTGCGTARPCF